MFTARKTVFSSRPGLSMIELLVVMGIVGMLTSLALPAIFAARESSRRGQCLSHLKQLSLAIHSFEGAFRKLPSSEPISLEGSPLPHGWMIYVTPYLEQQQLYDKYDFSKPWNDVANMPVTSTGSTIFACPATGFAGRRDFAPPPAAEPFAAISDYAAITHVDQRLVSLGLVDKAGVGAMPKKAQPVRDHITDGLSNTLLLIESAGRPQIWRRGSQFETLPASRTLGGAWASPQSDLALIGSDADGAVSPGKFAINRTNGEPAGNAFPHPYYGTDGTSQIYSFHTTCVNAAYADGSVHTIDESVDIRLLARWITRAGGEVVEQIAP